MLPDLGAGFVALCLEAYDNDVEAVLHNMLEGSLPDPLKGKV
jgi:activating signal cointegrator complex subunit 2